MNLLYASKYLCLALVTCQTLHSFLGFLHSTCIHNHVIYIQFIKKLQWMIPHGTMKIVINLGMLEQERAYHLKDRVCMCLIIKEVFKVLFNVFDIENKKQKTC